ncbi:MAG TPA: glycosyltransferase family 4 protein, partial [Verrucomicrobiae bacterium]|nr:glycosyltransferase family 4 protein [Verrucomicrobiae bacterium]
MKILIVHNTLNDSKSLSGALRHFLFMANEWTAAGHQTDFLAAKCAFPQLSSFCKNSRLISSDNFFDATNYVEKTTRYFPAYGHRMVTPHFTRLPETYDVIIASTQLIVEVYPAMVIARRQRAKLAAKVHHVLASQRNIATFFDRIFLWSERTTTRWMNRRAQLVICGTEFVKRDYHALEDKLGLQRHPNTQAYGYGVDLANMPLAWDHPHEYDVVHLGRMHEHKGVFDMPQVWREVIARKPNAKLLVIGEGPHRSRTQAMFAELGLSHTVRFTGGIAEAEKNRLLCRSRIGLSLSFEEGWGLSINEFLATGIPVVAYGLPIFDTVFPNQLIKVPIGDKPATARA